MALLPLPTNPCPGCEARDRLNDSLAVRVDALEAVVLAKDAINRVLQDELDSLRLRFERMRESQYPPIPQAVRSVAEEMKRTSSNA